MEPGRWADRKREGLRSDRNLFRLGELCGNIHLVSSAVAAMSVGLIVGSEGAVCAFYFRWRSVEGEC
jgi:hypothetical protein